MKYSESHEWIEETEQREEPARMGISYFAQKELGDIVYVELPELGSQVAAGQQIAVLESTKAAADVYSPVSGTIVAVNHQLKNKPELVNQSPEDEGWLAAILLSHPEELSKLRTSSSST